MSFVSTKKTIKVSKNSKVISFKYNGRQYTFVGEVHSGLKKDISPQIEDGILILECNKRYNNISLGELNKHYKSYVAKNKKIENESYIDLAVLYFTNQYKNIRNKKEQLKKVTKGKSVQVICIDERDPKDFQKTQVRTLKKKEPGKYNVAKNLFIRLRKEINKMKKSKVKDRLQKEINDIINNKMKENSSYLVQTLSEIILDYEIINNYILNDKIKANNITGILGKNHVNNIKKYLDI